MGSTSCIISQSSKAATEATPAQLRRSGLAVSECPCQAEVKQEATVTCTQAALTSALKPTRLSTCSSGGRARGFLP
eukprot:3452272-Rhodomonas_salina.1